VGSTCTATALLNPSDRKEMSRQTLHVKNEVAMRIELQRAVFELFRDLDVTERPEMPLEVEDRIVNVADIVTWARSAVYRDRFTRDIEVAPSAEGPSRFAKQLGSLWRALVVIGHEDPVGMICRVALDSMPPARSAALVELGDGVCSTNDLREVTRLSQSASRRVLEDLEALGLIEIIERGSGTSPSKWALTVGGRQTWEDGFADYLRSPAISRRGGRGEIRDITSGCCGRARERP
jgi:DNA-binding transcriptional ArsR family regulator